MTQTTTPLIGVDLIQPMQVEKMFTHDDVNGMIDAVTSIYRKRDIAVAVTQTWPLSWTIAVRLPEGESELPQDKVVDINRAIQTIRPDTEIMGRDLLDPGDLNEVPAAVVAALIGSGDYVPALHRLVPSIKDELDNDLAVIDWHSPQTAPRAYGLLWSRYGLSVPPTCRNDAKLPQKGFTWKNGEMYRPADWTRNTRSYAIRTGADGIFVVETDVDKTTGEEVGDESLRGLGIDPETIDTLQITSPSGGRHMYVRAPRGEHLPGPSAGKIAPGVDVRADRSVIVGPGSIRADGSYRISRARPIAECPGELWELVAATRPKPSKSRAKHARRPTSYQGRHADLTDLVQAMLDAPQGTRHDTLIRTGTAAARLRGTGGLRAIRIAAEAGAESALDEAKMTSNLEWCARTAEMDDPVMAAEDAMNDAEEDDDDDE